MNSYEKLMNTEKDLLFYDTETCGLVGMPVLLQYAVGKEGDIVLYDIWKNPVRETLAICEAMMKHVNIGFNLAFDHFQIQKLHSVFSLVEDKDSNPEDLGFNYIATLEEKARDGLCLKPYSALDLMIVARKGPYQSLMARKDIRIKSVPLAPMTNEAGFTTPLAWELCKHLERTIELDDIYFSKADADAPRWQVLDRLKKDGTVCRQFADVVLKFKASASLKALAKEVLGLSEFVFSDIELDPKHRPKELGYAPFANATSSVDKNWEVFGFNDNKDWVLQGHAWPAKIGLHIEHWATNADARKYAENDIVYTRGLYYAFGEPEHGEKDSILTTVVSSVRWHGYEIDQAGLAQLRMDAEEVQEKAPINCNIQKEIRAYVNACCDDNESLFLEETTKKARLEELSQWIVSEDEDCMKCVFDEDPSQCQRCGGTGVLKAGIHPAAKRAAEVLGVKVAAKEIELYDKLLTAGRFHASFNVTGTLSNRMSGGDGLNAQGINHSKAVRKCFPLKWGDYSLSGGDFDSFEVTIADAVYGDLDLRECIVAGKKLHGIFGTLLFPGHTYEQILDSDTNDDKYEFGNMYSKAKSGVFAMIYGGNASTLNRNLGIPMKVAEEAFASWGRMFAGIGESRKRVVDAHQPLLQPNGLGTAIEWVEPSEYVESFLGFRRYFTLEYQIAESLFKLANNLPKHWQTCDATVQRSSLRGEQKAFGALTSALYGAAFGICEGSVRAAANHEIQSPGAEMTKLTQVAIWELQPVGVHEWIVAPMNIHDEVISVTHPDYVKAEADIVRDTVESFRKDVPLVGMTWCLEMDNWAEKKGGGDNIMHVTYDTDSMLEQIKQAKAEAART